MMNMFSYILDFFINFFVILYTVYEKYVNIGTSIRIFINNFHVICFDIDAIYIYIYPLMNIGINVCLHRIIKVDLIVYMNLSCKHIHLFEMMSHLYFSMYKLFNYKYVHNVITNVLHMNRYFLFFFFSL